MKKKNFILALLISLFAFVSLFAEPEISPMSGWTYNAGARFNGRLFYSVPQSYDEQEGYAIVNGEKLHYWLYNTITYHNGDASEIYNKYVPAWIENNEYVIDYDNAKLINPYQPPTSLQSLMKQRSCDVAVLFDQYGWQSYPKYAVAIIEYLNSKKTYKATVYDIYTEDSLPADNPMILVKGGTFEMGDSTGEEKDAHLHKVTVSDFYMSQKEITFQEWVYTTGFYPNGYYSYYGEKPVPKEQWRYKSAIFIHWYEALTYCNLRSEEEGLTPCYASNGSTDIITNCRTDTEFQNITCDWNANGYRLPTEAEWEYAAKKDSRLSDMSYKHYEWCWDWYDSTYYEKSGGVVNPHGPEQGELLKGSYQDFFDEFHDGVFAQRVFRGGGGIFTNKPAFFQRMHWYSADLHPGSWAGDIDNKPFSFRIVRNAK